MSDERPPTRRAFVTRLDELRWTPGERSSPDVKPFAAGNPYIKAVAAELEQRVDADLMRCVQMEGDDVPIPPVSRARVVRPSEE
jgi:hypothetical protein